MNVSAGTLQNYAEDSTSKNSADKNSADKNEGWQAHLNLKFEHSGVRSVLKKSQHDGPLRVQRPFYPEGELAHVYILHPPGGVVGGDQLHINLHVSNKAQVLCTTPGSGKFYLSAGNWAQLNQTLQVTAGSSLEWLPQENILFAGARLRSRTKIKLEDDAVFIGCDISCLGRPTSNEIFSHGAFDSRLDLYHNKKLLLTENLRVFDCQDLTAATGLRGKAIQATLLAFPCTEKHLELAREELAEQFVEQVAEQMASKQSQSNLIAATLFDGLLVVRVLGDDSQTVKQQLISIWQKLRPALLNKAATLPRIWAT
ncbi:Urease accessory protein UreD [hydrothermal vent metagenome]|uniref:Urease accessory protein UreD n=1 Tax=hydrothermal vent metagenome TaxID=652676 RepID=A0A3B0W4K3_9ZZZZ